MYRLALASTVSLLLSSQIEVSAQFGVAGKKKKGGSTFENLNEMAKEQFDGAGSGMMDLDALASMFGGEMDMAEMEQMIAEAMADPETAAYMQQMESELMKTMDQLSNMSPEDLLKTATEAVGTMMNDEVMDSMFQDMDTLIEQLEGSGMVDAEKIEEYKKDPAQLKKDMKEGISQMQEALNDPETMKAAMEVMKNFGELINDPEALTKAMNGVNDLMSSFSEEMSSDDKIEEARLQILADPTFGGNDALASIYSSDDMKDLLKDPKKWRDAVKMGKGMMLNDEL
mmetsp:Transcript_13520/g.20587  ORF Transcript_13520/g.20587 Transcript_13520/m.20587 type:complete len:285 (-) Transcript_13520:194-1048(-)|eukprot:CAMPEP_0196802670 /NCGR_PEP_ID=MMETSP1362-20130617/2237_1 /TAXON_ID=163516 /ORGANISM="Leptocylindrus danicus, Strain CCMP1856" /LENGTH=284 /DNA_ID=CAMNT_0042174023 /DNA_START=48 /DNA_END=902 /DNA_ORIENTATION=+